MALKKWILPTPADHQTLTAIARDFDLSPLAAEILTNRGLDAAGIQAALSGSLEDPLALIDMDKAVARIKQAVEADEVIAVYGDYDCDGITATVILYTYLTSMGAEVICFIPEREEGYGLNKAALDQLKAQGAALIVTVDNGISAIEEAAYAAEIGLDLVVTDHHQPGNDLPQACAVVNPHRADCPSTFKELAGVGVAFKLITALEDGDYDTTLSLLADFVAIGTVGDLVPLRGENRRLVQQGVAMLSMSENPGLFALMKTAGLYEKVNAGSIAYGLAPRINAAGRYGQAAKALELFLTDSSERADALAHELNELNMRRRADEQLLSKQAEDHLRQHPEKLYRHMLVIPLPDINHGIVGIVASRMTEKYGKPSIILSVDGDVCVGSCRSVTGFHLHNALTACEEYLVRFGGHEMAAGLTVALEKLPEFEQALECYAAGRPPAAEVLTVDKVITSEDIALSNVQSLDMLTPFGRENPEPLFLLPNAALVNVTPLSDGSHSRLTLRTDTGLVKAVYFKMKPANLPAVPGDRLDLLVNLNLNEYNGETTVSVCVRDVRQSGFKQDAFFAAKAAFEDIMREQPVDARLKPRILPTREETGLVYTRLQGRGKAEPCDVENLFLRLSPLLSGINYCKFRVILEQLRELGLINATADFSDITVPKVTEKRDITQAAIYQRIEAM